MNPAVQEYLDLGFDVIPLKENDKRPLLPGWNQLSPEEQWSQAPDGANLGIRCGGECRVCVIDCDDKNLPGTYVNVTRQLAGWGFAQNEYPVVQTASGVGRHIYLSLAGDLPAGNYSNLCAEYGAGEVRYGPGAYVVSPPSVVDGCQYGLLGGDFRQLPRIDVADIFQLTGKEPVFVNHEGWQGNSAGGIPRVVKALLNGRKTDNFQSRSEVEQSILARLINAGKSYAQIEGFFLKNIHKPGVAKFAEKYRKDPKCGLEWLRISYESAVQFCQTPSPATLHARQLIAWATSKAWEGRTGSTDRAVFIAHCQIAERAGKYEYAASVRELAELAGIGAMTADRATHRLSEAGYLTLVQAAVGDLSNKYRLEVHNDTLPKDTMCGSVSLCSFQQHDSFRRAFGGLGKSGFQIWQYLMDFPHGVSAKDIAKLTGRHITTVRRILNKMSQLIDTVTGEIFVLVEKTGDLWIAREIDLDTVSQILGTAGLGRKQKERHADERRRHQKDLARIREQKNEQTDDFEAGRMQPVKEMDVTK